ncbi:hypothetical protein [Gordonia polyisoprenivorans]|uniref:hypothetical protein n=1 Tax=Gordonia polyisoprenivorans TaxID=84595 RepID=UPI000B99EA6A|nr:hypothetical protein [Gordonia polyisoprenivorans]OZC32852.1 hypothetical protein CJJ17_16195 [Gordonia polyisoprenivorans]UZF56267.1 hypothetical protein LH935_26985 [Gordonia polyisoprenivorans]WCB37340.1 hypothetical protein PHA63_25470 [Gordonia polyisoprenivorans]
MKVLHFFDMWDIGSGLAGVLGAVAGGVGTYSATWLNLKKQEHQADKQRDYELRDRRQAAHQDMVLSLYKFVDIAREVEACFDSKTPVDPDIKKAYLAAWEDLNIVRAAALLAGPKELSRVLSNTFENAADYSNVLDRRLAGNGRAQNFDILRTDFRASVDTYVDDARKLLSLDE